ncbi:MULTISPECIES: alternative ribosome rescue aminoacyl-tRNA hydrolase ArfB [Shewanella]|jgi:ribosome-associated protein|uniref:alternative ribosome rescue aminoacyl-tRNA hydrolase ArfB n=1 Tax=Shewanella TaxID=22 RepID=UPI0016779E7C|nr:alternative ribosome rescue aminoacyl-tRNA hydrolase ArfB [Shewanella fodinae]MCL2906508.1 aminoacyl-tRNA hydrolase [Shewanella fodinae]GGY93743.1 aminoacyl-tRNA hydrolase [Shewanella fodinae]
MIKISNRVQLPEQELEWQFIRASGAGGQHVNKVSTAAQLIFDIRASSLPEVYQQKLLQLSDHRISASGKIIIKCQQSRSQDDNRQQALAQFCELILSVTHVRKKRIATKATRSSQIKRVDSKKKHGAIKSMRQQKISS